MADNVNEGTLTVDVQVHYPDGAPEVRETLRGAGDLVGAAVGVESLGADVVAVLDPLACGIETQR